MANPFGPFTPEGSVMGDIRLSAVHRFIDSPVASIANTAVRCYFLAVSHTEVHLRGLRQPATRRGSLLGDAVVFT